MEFLSSDHLIVRFLRILSMTIFLSCCVTPPSKFGFYDPKALTQQPAEMDAIEKSTVQILSREGICTAVFLSRDGHLATAQHCSHCASESIRLENPEVIIHQATDRHAAIGQRCSFHIRGWGNVGASIAYIGDGSANFEDRDAHRFSADVINRIRNLRQDIIIFKLDVSQLTPCIRSNLIKPRVGEAVWTFGYPSTARRIPDSISSRGPDHLQVTFGHVIASPFDSREFVEWVGRSNLSSLKQIERPRLYVDGDVGNGMSGGPMVDQDGTLVGIFSTYWRGSIHNDNDPSFLKAGIDIASLYQSVVQMRGEEGAKRMFECTRD